MPYPDTTTKRLIPQIIEAFADVPQPTGELIPGTCHCDECMGVQHYFADRHWREMLHKCTSFSDIEHGMCFLNREAWHFFLPAYLIGSIKNDRWDTFEITPRVSERFPEAQPARFAMLTAPQCRVVQTYLEHGIGLFAETFTPGIRFWKGNHSWHYCQLALAFWREQEQKLAAIEV